MKLLLRVSPSRRSENVYFICKHIHLIRNGAFCHNVHLMEPVYLLKIELMFSSNCSILTWSATIFACVWSQAACSNWRAAFLLPADDRSARCDLVVSNDVYLLSSLRLTLLLLVEVPVVELCVHI